MRTVAQPHNFVNIARKAFRRKNHLSDYALIAQERFAGIAPSESST